MGESEHRVPSWDLSKFYIFSQLMLQHLELEQLIQNNFLSSPYSSTIPLKNSLKFLMVIAVFCCCGPQLDLETNLSQVHFVFIQGAR